MSAVGVVPTARINGRLKGRLAVVAHQARDLQSKQLLGTMDPYAVLSVRSEKIKSVVHTDGGRTPKWEHAFCFNIECDENEVLHVKVMNKELVTDDTIGIASIAMKDLVIYHQVRRWYQLVDKNNFSKIAGAIEMTVDYQGSGVEYLLKVAPPAVAASAPLVPLAAPVPAPAPAPVLAAPAPAPYYPPITPTAAPPAAAAYYPPPAAAPSPYGYPPQPAYAAPPQPYAAPPQPYGAPAPPPAYYQPPAAPYGYAPPPQPAYYPQPAPQVVYAAPPQPTVVYQQPRPEVVIIEERGPMFW